MLLVAAALVVVVLVAIVVMLGRSSREYRALQREVAAQPTKRPPRPLSSSPRVATREDSAATTGTTVAAKPLSLNLPTLSAILGYHTAEFAPVAPAHGRWPDADDLARAPSPYTFSEPTPIFLQPGTRTRDFITGMGLSEATIRESFEGFENEWMSDQVAEDLFGQAVSMRHTQSIATLVVLMNLADGHPEVAKSQFMRLVETFLSRPRLGTEDNQPQITLIPLMFEMYRHGAIDTKDLAQIAAWLEDATPKPEDVDRLRRAHIVRVAEEFKARVPDQPYPQNTYFYFLDGKLARGGRYLASSHVRRQIELLAANVANNDIEGALNAAVKVDVACAVAAAIPMGGDAFRGMLTRYESFNMVPEIREITTRAHSLDWWRVNAAALRYTAERGTIPATHTDLIPEYLPPDFLPPGDVERWIMISDRDVLRTLDPLNPFLVVRLQLLSDVTNVPNAPVVEVRRHRVYHVAGYMPAEVSVSGPVCYLASWILPVSRSMVEWGDYLRESKE